MPKKTIFILTFVFLTSCQSDVPIVLDYCKMHAEDQSFLDDSFKRKEMFKKKIHQIMAYTRQQGFPKVSFYDEPFDSCKYWAVTGTMIHIAQAEPALLFNQKTIDFFKKEMEKGNLDKELFIPAFKISSRTNTFCETMKPDIEYALQLWELDASYFEEATYIKCE